MNQKNIRESINEPFIKIVNIDIGKDSFEEIINNFEYSNHPITSIPEELKIALQNTLFKDERNIFQNIISSKECSEKTLQNKTLNSFIQELINRSMIALNKEKSKNENENNLESKFLFAYYGPPANIILKFITDSRLLELDFYDLNLNINDFKRIDNNLFSLESYNKKDNATYKSIGLNYRFLATGTKEDIFRLNPFDRDDFHLKKDTSFRKFIELLLIPHPNERTNDYWLCLDHFLFYEVKIAPYDRLNKNEKNRLN